ncbi:MAG: hypothetical protein ABL890_02025 [Candidatus Peribacteraceae bacterium]
MSDNLVQIQELIDSAMSSLKTANAMLRDVTGVADPSRERIATRAGSMSRSIAPGSDAVRVVEGIFDGQNMVDADGQTYPIPANYASKSKLVEGDGMKLSITEDGKFIYKQIAPIDRKSVVGVLISEDGQYKVLSEGKAYRILLASITFYRADIGDQVTILIPTKGEASWGAIDAVIPRSLTDAAAETMMKKTRAKKETDGEMSPEM